MACQIKILGVIGQKKSGALIGIKVVGSASDCDLVIVTITCDGRTQQFQSKVTDGAWSVVVPPGDPKEHPCRCDENIDVTAVCKVEECKDRFTGTLICQDVTSCPDVFVNVTPIDPNSRCDSNGERLVSGTVTVSPDPSNAVGVTVTVNGVSIVNHSATAAPYTLNFSVSLGPGMHVLKVIPSDPTCGSFGQSINVPSCPGTEACPKVEVQRIKEGDCRDGKRIATVSVLVTPQGGPTDAELIHNSKKLDSATAQVAPFVLSGADTFTSSGDTVIVKITQPLNCPPIPLVVNVKPCPGGNGDGGDDDDESGGCLIGRIIVAVLLATALFLWLLVFCGAVPLVIAAVAATVAAAIAFAIWWALCGSKCGALLLTWQVAMIGAWVSAYLVSCCLAALILAIGLGAASLVGFFGWLSACKPSNCKIFSELLWVYVAAIGPIFVYLGNLAPCGLPVVPVVAATIAAMLAVAVGVACKK